MKNLLRFIVFSMFLLPFNLFSQSDCTPSQDCASAPLFCGKILESYTFTNAGNGPGSVFNFCGTLENTQYFRFVSCGSNLSVILSNTTCQIGDGMQLALLDGCGSTNLITCNQGNFGGEFDPLILTSVVVPGKEYILLVDGFAGDVCEYKLDIISGIDTSDPQDETLLQNGKILGDATPCGIGQYTAKLPVCSGQGANTGCNANADADRNAACYSYFWDLPVGAEIISPDPSAATVIIKFTQAVNGFINVTPEWACTQICTECTSGCQGTIPPLAITASAMVQNECADAPFLCAGFLETNTISNSCSFATNLDGNSCLPLENNRLFRLSTCGDSLSLKAKVTNCSENRGLEFMLLDGDCTAGLTPLTCGDTIRKNQTRTLNYGNLTPQHTYYLLIDGLDYDQCDVKIDVNFGMSMDTISSVPNSPTCVCTNGTIQGPTALCPGDVATFKIIDGSCNGGNGSGGSFNTTALCNLPQGLCETNPKPDSVIFHWVIPASATFVGASTGKQVKIKVNPALIGIATNINAEISVWVEQVNLTPTNFNDSAAVLCNCQSITAPCQWAVTPFDMKIKHTVTSITQAMTCSDPCVILGGNSYCMVGNYTYFQDNCETKKVTVTNDIPVMSYTNLQEIDLGNGTYTVSFNFAPSSATITGGVGVSTGSSFVSVPIACGTDFMFFVNVAGCQDVVSVGGSFNCSFPMISSLTASTDTLTCTKLNTSITCVASAPGVFYTWSGPGITANSSSQVSVTVPGTYTVKIKNNTGVVLDQKSITIAQNIQKPVVNLGVDISFCQGKCDTIGYDVFPTGTSGVWNTTSTQPFIKVCAAATYTLTLTNAGNGCKASDAITVSVSSIAVTNLGEIGKLSCTQPCITFMGINCCEAKVYEIPGDCKVTRFSVGIDPSLTTINLGVVDTIDCTQPCVTYLGESFCIAGTYQRTVGCDVKKFTIAIDSILPVTDLGVVGILDCTQPSLVYLGDTFNLAGTYTKTINCEIKKFTIDIDSILPVTDLGVVGTLDCNEPSFTYLGENFTIAGIYEREINCEIKKFTIAIDSILPVMDFGVVGTLDCNLPSFTYLGEIFTIAGTYEREINCEIKKFTIELDSTLPVIQLGVVGTLDCNQPTLTYLGETFPVAGDYERLIDCEIKKFTILIDSILPVIELGVVGTLDCNQPDLDYLGENFTNAGDYERLINCEIKKFTILIDSILPVIELGVVGTLDCNQPDLDYLGENFTNAGDYERLINCEIKKFTILIDSILPVIELGVVGTLDCGNQSVDYLGENFTEAGDYVRKLNCEVNKFTIAIDTTLPVIEKGIVRTITCDDKCVNYKGESFCAAGDFERVFDCEIEKFTIDIDVDAPTAAEINLKAAICPEKPIGSFEIISVEGGKSPYLYALGNGYLQGDSIFKNLDPGQYILNIEDANGCVFTKEIVLPTPETNWVYIGEDTLLLPGTSLLFDAKTNVVPKNITWKDNFGNTWSDTTRLVTAPIGNGSYFCEIVDTNGCKVSDVRNVTLDEKQLIFIPNTLQFGNVNGNDRFAVFAAPGYVTEIVSLGVYDRWGESLYIKEHFPANDPLSGWTGMSRNKAVSPGVYMYHAEVLLYTGELKRMNGTVTLMK
jgi:nitrate reductase NapE component